MNEKALNEEKRMKNLTKGFALVCLLLVVGLINVGCSSGGVEDEFAKAISEVNKDWVLYEVKQVRGATVIKVEVLNSSKVPFKQAKKAMEALQKIDPKLAGYIEFYNAEVGMVLRKVELIPAAT